MLHPTSLPSKHGIGDFGEEAFRFVDILVDLKQSLWQMLPLGPVTMGYSPYQSPSAFAGNPMLISLEKLAETGWLKLVDLQNIPIFSIDFVDFVEVEIWKNEKLKLAFQNFQQGASAKDQNVWKKWQEKQSFWLQDYAVFMAMKEMANGVEWNKWPFEWRSRDTESMKAFEKQYDEKIGFHKFVQWIFFQQWEKLRDYAHQKGIQLIGDLPIFVAFDSADVWANPQEFELNEKLEPTVVAGVPPDYFSDTGQRWGNPLYRWKTMKKDGYQWWKKRLAFLLEQFDVVRIDHFRGFESYWEIPASEKTAIIGKWQPGPGIDFFLNLKKELGDLPIIAEDLGLITPEVEKLRNDCNFPGMKVLQFAFFAADDAFLPHNYPDTNCVVYSGTHDNNTTLGWFHEISNADRDRLRVYMSKNVEADNVCYEMMRLAWASTAAMALAPLQDLLTLNSECRMNLPGSFGGSNWGWRCQSEQLDSLQNHWVIQLTETYARNE